MQRNSSNVLTLFFVLSFLLPTFVQSSPLPRLDFNVVIKPRVVEVRLEGNSFKTKSDICFEHNPSMYGFGAVYKKDEKQICVPSQEKFIINYKVKSSQYPGKLMPGEDVPNMVLGKSVFLFGSKIFLKPIFATNVNITPTASIKFHTVDMKNFISSLGGEKKSFKMLDFKSLMESIILAGDLKKESTKIDRKRYYFAFVGSWEKTKSKVYNSYKKIAKQQLKTWGFMPADFATIVLVKNKKIISGTGFQYNNAIIYFLPESVNVNDVEFLKLLAHEHFHIWNGFYLRSSDAEKEKTGWFHEGVTNYYALMSLVSSGVISEKEFLNYISKVYLKYDSSYQHGLPATSTEREMFLVMAMDLEIMRASGLSASFDIVLENMSVKSKYRQIGYTNEDLKKELMRVANWDITNFFDRYIYTQKRLYLDPYFSYLGLKFSPALVLIKDLETKSYNKWIARQK